MPYRTAFFNINSLMLAGRNQTNPVVKNNTTIEEISFVITASWLAIIREHNKESAHSEFENSCDESRNESCDESAQAQLRMSLAASRVPVSFFNLSVSHMGDRKALSTTDLPLVCSRHSLSLLAFFTRVGIRCTKYIDIDCPWPHFCELIPLDDNGRGFIYSLFVQNINFYNFGVYKKARKIYLFLPTSGEYLFEVHDDFKNIKSTLRDVLVISLNIDCGDARRNYALCEAKCDIREVIFN